MAEHSVMPYTKPLDKQHVTQGSQIILPAYPILFLVLGGAIIALAIERTGLHRRLALAIIRRGGSGPGAMLFAFMAATAAISRRQ